jgi:hypothetical protein
MHLPPDITLALSQFFQNDDPGLALTHALQVHAVGDAVQQQPPVPDAAMLAAEEAHA